ncbi:MAG TPA: Flp pilus assembly protein CpaB, partial [Nitrolancea sp.]|nr:Flp pilus assembly protein CpaB [Nitrolancea sp.]
LTMQPFPADFVPQGAVAQPEQAVGKYATTHITKGQIVLSNQLSPTKRVGQLSLSVPSGKVAIALPMTDLMSTNGAIKAGDHIDIVLTLDLKEIRLDSAQAGAAPASSAGGDAKNPVTQTTLQNVEVLSVGQTEDTSSSASSATTSGNNRTQAVIVLLDPQDALVLDYAKNSGGIVDLALRSPDDTQQVKTDSVTIDYLFQRFNFQRPGPVP